MLVGALFGIGCVAVVTGIVFGLREVAPVLSLGVLYIFAVLPVAVLFGLGYAAAVSVLSMLAFNFFFLPPTHTLSLHDSENWVALAVYLLTAILVSELAARTRRRAAEAEQREREANVLARASAALLQDQDVQSRLGVIADDAARAIGADSGRIELDSRRRPGPGEAARDLQAGNRHVGRLFLPADAGTDSEAEARLLPALASLLAVAIDRERLRGKALEADAFRRSDAVKTAVLRSVSHDLRSPLTAIRAAAEGLQSSALELSDADRQELLETIRVETKRLDRLVANLLDLSLLESGGALAEPALWTLDDLVGRSLEMVGQESDRVTVSLPPQTLVVQVDAAQIERVLANVIENAIKFSPSGEPVELAAEHREREVVVRVSDSGPGIPPGDLERIFEPFSRGRSGGSGLGLAIVRGFTEVNGGRVWVEPRTGGHDDRPLASRGARPGISAVSALRILVVDDEPQILRALQTSLRAAGYEVESAGDAAGALAAAAAHPPDAISSISSFRTEPAPRSPGGCANGRTSRFSSSPSSATTTRRWPRSTPAQTTTSPSRSALTSSLRGCEPRCDARARRPSPCSRSASYASTSRRERSGSPGSRVSLTRTEYDLLRVLAQSPGKLFTHPALLREVWGPLRAGVALPPRLRLAAPPQDRAGSGAAALPADGARGRLPAGGRYSSWYGTLVRITRGSNRSSRFR